MIPPAHTSDAGAVRDLESSQGSDALTVDGRVVRIRPITPGDEAQLRALFDRTSEDSLYLRFFSGGRQMTDAEVARLLRPHDSDHVSLCAEESGVIVGVGSWERSEAAAATDQPLPAGNRVAVIGNAGGVNVLAADAAETAGLSVPELSAQLQAGVAAHASGAAGIGNPVDLGAAATPAALTEALTRIAESGEVDAIVAVFAGTLVGDVRGMLAAVGDAADRAADIPFAMVLIGVPDAPASVGSRKIPVYPLPEQALRALGHAVRYGQWQKAPLGSRPSLSSVDARGARALVRAALADGGGWQPVETTGALLRCYGIEPVTGEVVADVEDAVAAAGRLGTPVALKAADAAVVHKSDIGAVALDLRDAAAVRAAYRRVGTALERSAPRVLVQPMAPSGVELVVGVVHDPRFGSLVMAGLGGVFTELLADRAFPLLPLTGVDLRARRAPRLIAVGGPQDPCRYRHGSFGPARRVWIFLVLAYGHHRRSTGPETAGGDRREPHHGCIGQARRRAAHSPPAFAAGASANRDRREQGVAGRSEEEPCVLATS